MTKLKPSDITKDGLQLSTSNDNRKPSALDNVEDLEKLIDARTQKCLDVLQVAIDHDFDDHQMVQLTTYATLDGRYASIPTGRLEDMKVEEPTEARFKMILARAKVAIGRIIEMKKHYSAGPYYTGRQQRRALAKRLGISWKQLQAQTQTNIPYQKLEPKAPVASPSN